MLVSAVKRRVFPVDSLRLYPLAAIRRWSRSALALDRKILAKIAPARPKATMRTRKIAVRMPGACATDAAMAPTSMTAPAMIMRSASRAKRSKGDVSTVRLSHSADTGGNQPGSRRRAECSGYSQYCCPKLDAAPQVVKVMIEQAGDLLLGVAPAGRIADRLIGHRQEEVELRGHRGGEEARVRLRAAAGRGSVPGQEGLGRPGIEARPGRCPGQQHIAQLAPGLQGTGVLPVQDDKLAARCPRQDIGRAEVPVADDHRVLRRRSDQGCQFRYQRARGGELSGPGRAR